MGVMPQKGPEKWAMFTSFNSGILPARLESPVNPDSKKPRKPGFPRLKACGVRKTESGFDDRRLDDLARIGRRLALGQGVDMLHARDHLTPDGVLIVQIGHIIQANEELA